MERRINIYTNTQRAGTLAKEGDKHIFTYTSEAITPISVTMPIRSESWRSIHLHPIFEMNLPEGALKERIRERFAKVKQMDDLGLLELIGPHVIGRVKYGLPGKYEEPITLDDILHDDTHVLFEKLMERFAIRSGVSGVQPKILLQINDKNTLTTEEYIVKSWGDEYPELAFNEFFCMEAVRLAGLPTPEYKLSENRSMFIMKRFDLKGDGSYLGFEDGCVLLGKGTIDKYHASYEDLAKVLKASTAAESRLKNLRTLFKALVMNHFLRNGDAHLKNFAILYDEDYTDARMAPIYDVVCTTVYLKEDLPALNMSGGKVWWKKKTYIGFGKQTCKLTTAEIDDIFECCADATKNAAVAMFDYVKTHPDISAFAERLLLEWNKGLESFGFDPINTIKL
ncbi:MAG: type II toxin-antitoxin system HipA family toxin [Sulfuricurvum sp.]|uniref:type II toxin-antitoxin system HipA family toxin n=1 Tax=Sulfuricurvum sp. TaxID=2025608 RepID=UPI0025F5BC68|nr:type II toxin-antitoxin system HipA family toxin [Sulfuricurvum sp.]MCK9372377.1 type II toxin-antitoxin system HipA family toxin [Sulfuricurvum sp.]